MQIQDFFKKYNGKGLDFDSYFGFQCTDLVEQYNQDVVGAPRLYGNAIDVWNNYPKDFYTRIENKPDNAPDEGDIIIWSQGVGQFGLIAICKESDFAKFISFDQNWPVGSVCHFQDHNYTNVLGWLKPKAQVITPPVPPQPVMSDQVKIPLGEYGELEIQQIKGKLGDLNRIEKQLDEAYQANNQQVTLIEDLREQLKEKDQKIDQLEKDLLDIYTKGKMLFKSPFAKLLYQIAKAVG